MRGQDDPDFCRTPLRLVSRVTPISTHDAILFSYLVQDSSQSLFCPSILPFFPTIMQLSLCVAALAATTSSLFQPSTTPSVFQAGRKATFNPVPMPNIDRHDPGQLIPSKSPLSTIPPIPPSQQTPKSTKPTPSIRFTGTDRFGY